MTIERERFTASIEHAADGDAVRISGYANTFGVMRSRRIIHPDAAARWLANNQGTKLPMLANHGMVDEGFATIGKITTLRIDRDKGLYFEATLARGTKLADEARALLAQGMLDSLSIGWKGRASFVRADDVTADPFIKQKMAEAGAAEVMAFIGEFELVEISLVDVGDDRGSKLAASIEGAVEARLKPLLDRFEAASNGAGEAGGASVANIAAQVVDELRARLPEIYEFVEAKLVEPDHATGRLLLSDEDTDADGDCGHAGHGTAPTKPKGSSAVTARGSALQRANDLIRNWK